MAGFFDAFKSAFNSRSFGTIVGTIATTAAGEFGARLASVASSQGYQPTPAAQSPPVAQNPLLPQSSFGYSSGDSLDRYLPYMMVGGFALLAILAFRGR